MTRSFLRFAGLLTGLFTAPAFAGQARALQRTPIFRSAIATESTPPSSSRTRFR